MSKGNTSRDEQLERLQRLAAMSDDDIDTSDIPELTADFGAHAERGKFYRPVKEVVTIRLDADILDWFKRNAAEGKGYQTAINAALREHIGRK